MVDKKQEILESVFGYKAFRLEQKNVIDNVLAKEDSLVIMPTGGGKSLCFQIPALILDGLTIVVSPLIALMNDQVEALKLNGIAAAALHSNISSQENSEIFQNIRSGKLNLLYVSPEKLMSGNFLEYLKDLKIALFAIDEAHCVSVWGNDFRPEYIRLKAIKEEFPNVPLIALTATADQATQEDIKLQLGLTKAKFFLSSFERKNISIESRPGQDRIKQIINFVKDEKGEAGIVYCLSRKNTEKVAKKLMDQGFKAAYYHAGMNAEDRIQIQRNFQNDELDIICATIAFGMGIDKANIRWVIHYNLPKTIESYYQEIGRSGRDGSPAKALLFYSWGDFLNLKKFVDESESEEAFKNIQRMKLERMWQFSSADSCRTNLILNYFGEYRSEPCGHCDNCLRPPVIFDGTTYCKMALSAIIRSEEQLTNSLLIDVLRGSFKSEITNRGLDKIKTFGVGRDVPAIHWMHYLTQMINQGLIYLDMTDYSRLKTTPLSKEVLFEDAKISLSKFEAATKSKSASKAKQPLNLENLDASLLDKLKDWRNSLARERNVPAYVILANKTLQIIASEKPKTDSDLLAVDGIGKVKLSNFGAEIFRLVEESD